MLSYRVLWTVHQVYPHEHTSARLDRCAARALAAAAHALIVHDDATAVRLRAELPGAGHKLVLIPHGSFIGVYPPGRSRAAVRAELGIAPGTFVFIAFGHVRGYKDVDVLLDGFAHAMLDDAALVIAGMPIDPAGTALIEARAAADPRIRAVLRFVADDKVAELFGAADAAVISRGDGGTSGALILSLSLGAPAVVATSPTYVELIGHGDAGWTFSAGNAGSLARALELAASDRVAARAKGRAAMIGAAQLSWTDAARRTAALVDKTRA
jgi:glycosyltransferase involved in cell wall biosynthesis